MAVGSRFDDPDTQAAIAAQGGQPAPAAEPVQPEPMETPAAPAAETPPVTPEATEPEPDTSAVTPNMEDLVVPSDEEVAEKLSELGYTEEALSKELWENDGKLTPETEAKLKSAFDPAIVDKTVEDFQAQYNKDVAPKKNAIAEMNNFIYGELAGGDIEKGQENLAKLSEWAQKNLDPAELTLINKKLASGDKDLVRDGLTQAVAKWKKGQVRPMMSGDAAAASNVPVKPAFKPLTRAEFREVMKSEKYQTDPDYQREIDDRRRKTMETEGWSTPEYSASNMPTY